MSIIDEQTVLQQAETGRETEDVQPLTWLNSLPVDLPADCWHLVGAILRRANGKDGYVIVSITFLAEFGHMRRNKIKPTLDAFISAGYLRLVTNGNYKAGKSKTYQEAYPKFSLKKYSPTAAR